MTLIINGNTLVTVVVFIILVKLNLCNAECNLAKIFRTPRDFDHLEIVERNGFDRTEPSTTPPPPDIPKCKSTKKNGNNCAKAHVSLRFGTDYGGGHIMKIPHQSPTHLLGNSMTHHPNTIPNANFFYPPPQPYRTPAPCPSHQYYHPYPPPVPYVFPNYYFWSPEQESTYLPAQLNEYFMRHPDFVVARYPHNEEVFIGGRPVRRGQVGKVMIPTDFVDANSPIKIIEDVNVAPNNLPVGIKPVHVIRSRLLAPRDSTRGAVKDNAKENNEIKRDCTSQQKDDDIELENTISMEFSDSFEESPYGKHDQTETADKNIVNIPKLSSADDENQAVDTSELKISEPNGQDTQNVVGDLDVMNSKTPNSTKEFINDLEQLVIESLVEYNCENCTDIPKMLVSYPITKRDDILTPDTEKTKLFETSSCSDGEISKQSKFADNIDRLKSLKTKDIVEDETHQGFQYSNSSINAPSTGKNFTKDVDDLLSILIEIIDTDMPTTSKPSYPDYSSLFPGVLSMAKPYVADDSSLYPDVISPFSSFLPKTIPPPPPPPTPLSTILNLILGNYASPYTYPGPLNSQTDYVTYLTQYNDYISKMQGISLESVLSPSSDRYDSDPMISREAYLKITPVTEEAKLASLGILPKLESRFNVEDKQDPYVPLIKSSIPRATVEPRLQTTNWFRQEKGEDSDELEYISLLSRANIEPAPSKESDLVTATSYSNTPGDLPPSLQPVSGYCENYKLVPSRKR